VKIKEVSWHSFVLDCGNVGRTVTKKIWLKYPVDLVLCVTGSDL